MNIYKKRLCDSYRVLLFLQKIYPSEKIRYWRDIQCHRDGTPQRLWWLRESLKLSISDFAKSIGFCAEKYERFERIGEKVPEKVINRVAKKYNVRIEWLKAEIG